MDLTGKLKDHSEILTKASEELDFSVFLCGPSIQSGQHSSVLRKELRKRLEEEGFSVILGEDEGLEEISKRDSINAQDNELEFISKHCNAVIVIADSVGSCCELGLFSWHFYRDDGMICSSQIDFSVLVDKEYEGEKSYLNEGPIKALGAFGGHAYFIDFQSCASIIDEIVTRFKIRKGVWIVDGRRGRPPR